MKRPLCVLTSLFFLSFLLAGCIRSAPDAGFAELPALTGDVSQARDAWLFRHALVLNIPPHGASLSFTGIMRYESMSRTAHVVGLGGVGMTLFDLRVGETSFDAHFLHPSIMRLRSAADRIASVVRFVWLESLPLAVNPPEAAIRTSFAAFRDMRGTSLKIHLFDEGALRETFAWEGGAVTRVIYGEGIWPREIRVSGEGYTLSVRLLEARRLEEGNIP